MKIICAHQKHEDGTPHADWLQARTGRITASRIGDVMSYLKPTKAMIEARVKPEESQKRKDYRMEILCERLTAVPAEHFVSKPMKFGSEYEDDARREYELKMETMVDQTGFVLHTAFDYAGCSPDGLVGTEGAVQIKVPNTETHLGYLLGDVVPEEYKPQMYFEMDCCELAWSDFVSYDPRLPDPLKLFVKRLHYDDERVQLIAGEVLCFNDSVNAWIDMLRKRFGDFKLPAQIAAKVQSQDYDGLGISDEEIRAVDPAWQG
jgi:hypothetical protein